MSPTEAEGAPLIRLVRAIRAGRRWILLTAACCAVLATAASLVRKPTYRGQVYMSLGAIKPVGWLEDPQDLVRKLSSPAQFSILAGLGSVAEGTLTATTVEGVLVTKEDFDRLSFHGRQDGTRLIGFYVDSPNERIARAISERVTRSIVDRHAHLYDELIKSKKAQIDYFEDLLSRIEKKTGASEKEISWQGVVDVAARIAKLEEDQMSPAARPTEIVLGPDVEPINPFLPPALATAIGFLAGLFLAIMTIVVTLSVPRDLIEALRQDREPSLQRKTEDRAPDDGSARDVVS